MEEDNNSSLAEDTPLLNGTGPRSKPSQTFTKGGKGEKVPGRRIRHITRLVTVEPLIVLVFVSYSASQPFMSQYVYYRMANVMGLNDTLQADNDSQCNVDLNDSYFRLQQEVQSRTSLVTLSLALTYIVPALVSTLFLGAYSDQAGRKVAMIPALAAFLVRSGATAVIVALDLPLWLLYPLMFLEGLMGSAVSILVASFAYVSDITTHANRSRQLVIIEICMGLGNTAAQIGLGYFITLIGFFWPCVIFFCINCFNLIYAAFILPETIIKDDTAKLLTTTHVKKIVRLYVVDESKRRWKLQLSLVIFALVTLPEIGITEVQTLTFLNSPLCWTSIQIGYFIGIAYVIKNFTAIVLMTLCLSRIGDIGLVILGCLSGMGYQIVLAFATETFIVYLAPVAGFAMALTQPMLRSSVSKLVRHDEQGALFSSQGWFQIFAALAGAMVFNAVYSATLYLVHGFVFLLAACFVAVGLVLSLILFFRTKQDLHLEREHYIGTLED